jgi:hypothetical protein
MEKTKFLVVAVIWLISISEGKSQDIQLSKNTLYIELLGSGGLYSFNYERHFSPNISGRIGFSTFAISGMLESETATKTRITVFPVLITYLSGKGKSHFEIAGGMLLGLETEPNASYAIIDLTAFLGYRYQPPGGGFIFRIGLTPFLSLDNDAHYPDTGYMTSAGISLGYHF